MDTTTRGPGTYRPDPPAGRPRHGGGAFPQQAAVWRSEAHAARLLTEDIRHRRDQRRIELAR